MATLTARVRNLTAAPLSGVTVQIWYTDPSITLEFPSPAATLVDEGVVSIPADGVTSFSAPWSVPTTPNSGGEYHWCVGVVVKHPDDLPVSTHPVYSNNVAIHNFHPAAMTTATRALHFEAVNNFSLDARFDIFVTAPDLPAGWSVQLDPKRPQILHPGERYQGFATVDVPKESPRGEAQIQIQGALTPLRPGAVRPVGGGINFAVTYDPEAVAPAIGGLWYSVQLGYNFPLGSFDKDFDAGPSATLGLEYPLTADFSLTSLFGYHFFRGKSGTAGDLDYMLLSLKARQYFAGSSWHGFVQGGAGGYFAHPGDDALGLSLGVGFNRRLHSKLFLELALDGHCIAPGGDERYFLDSRIAIKFRL